MKITRLIDGNSMKEIGITVNRSDEVNHKFDEVSKLIDELNLNAADHNKLVAGLVDMTNLVEHDAYLQGFDIGIKAMKDLNSKDK